MDDAVVPCQRCGRLGAKAFRGWSLLCEPCQRDDMSEWDDDKCRNCGHATRDHGDRAVSVCVHHVPVQSFYHKTVSCDCPGLRTR